MGLTLPGGLEYALGFIGGGGLEFPKGDEDALRDMGDAYSAAAAALRSAGADVHAGSGALGSVITGPVQQSMSDYFDSLAGHKGLSAIADNFAKCDDLCSASAIAVLVSKTAFITSLTLFAAELAADIALAVETLGASMAAAAAEAAITGVALRLIIRQLIEEIAAAITKNVLKEIAVDVAKEVAKSAAQSAVKEGVREAVAMNFFGSGLSAGSIAGEAGTGAAEGAVGAVATAGARVNARAHGHGSPDVGTGGGAGRPPTGDGEGGSHPDGPGIGRGHDDVAPTQGTPHPGGTDGGAVGGSAPSAGAPGRAARGGDGTTAPGAGSPRTQPQTGPSSRASSERARSSGEDDARPPANDNPQVVPQTPVAHEVPESVGKMEAEVAKAGYKEATATPPADTPTGRSQLGTMPMDNATMTAVIADSAAGQSTAQPYPVPDAGIRADVGAGESVDPGIAVPMPDPENRGASIPTGTGLNLDISDIDPRERGPR